MMHRPAAQRFMAWFTARMLGSAVRRWPEESRAELSREWAAELHALREEAGVAGPVRVWRQLRFAASLATARTHDADAPMRGGLRRPSPARAQTVWLLLAPVLTLLSAAALQVPLFLMAFGWVTLTPITSALFAAGNYAVQGVLAALFGTLLGRRFLRRMGQPAGVAGGAWATLPVIGGLLIVDGLARAAGQNWAGTWLAVVAALCLAVLLPPAAIGVATLARRRRGLAVFVAGLAAPALTLAAVYAMVLLAPRPASAGGPWWWLGYLGRESLPTVSYHRIGTELPIETMLPVLPGFLFTTTILALAQAIRLAGPPLPARVATTAITTMPAPERPNATVTAPPPERPNTTPAIARGPWWHRTALAAAAYSVLAWAVTLTYLTPNIGVQSSWPGRIGPDGTVAPAIPAGWPEWSTEEARLWMHELQLSCIVCAALCLLYAAAFRGRPLLPVLAGSAVLLVVNMVVVRAGATTPRLLPWLAAGGLLLGVAVWWAANRREPDRQHPYRPHRLVITITVLAALLVPGSFFPRIYVLSGVQAPPVLLAVALGLPTILTVLAAMGVLATSARTRRGPGWRLPAVLALVPALGGIAYYQDRLFAFYLESGLPTLLIFMAPLALAAPVAVWTIVAIHARPVSPQRIGRRVLLTLLLFAAGWPIAVATILVGTIISWLVLFPMEYGRTYDGLVYVPGAIALGLLLGYLTALRPPTPHPDLAPEPTPAPTPAATADNTALC